MPESLDVLITRLDEIEADLQAAVLAHRAEIAAVSPEHRTGATNLVRYTTLRQQDLRDLQNDLLDLGATSLATAEANVLAKLQAARNVLAALRGPKVRTGPTSVGPAVGRARVSRDDTGRLIASAKLWLVSSDRPTPPAAPVIPAGRPALTVSVDPA
ncbi:hypothetical protein OM076_44275 [Solirubrobacter ginsenosidimutans]|uniref:Uncharacterized protein n=1 Tax=Solirubrobacter ginsenosidimutans TaxID=490573 RepID=A0A9X3N2K4_9ACTN|nr:hypothetical protein [Solirubrobacter ginsenosidimutans]MDA0167359.1 hypothetical protein [Solirubrobacter ginsenosidimutans]